MKRKKRMRRNDFGDGLMFDDQVEMIKLKKEERREDDR